MKTWINYNGFISGVYERLISFIYALGSETIPVPAKCREYAENFQINFKRHLQGRLLDAEFWQKIQLFSIKEPTKELIPGRIYFIESAAKGWTIVGMYEKLAGIKKHGFKYGSMITFSDSDMEDFIVYELDYNPVPPWETVEPKKVITLTPKDKETIEF